MNAIKSKKINFFTLKSYKCNIKVIPSIVKANYKWVDVHSESGGKGYVVKKDNFILEERFHSN